MYKWEVQLFERKLKIENKEETIKIKSENLKKQSQEINQNLKKLKLLTSQYEEIL